MSADSGAQQSPFPATAAEIADRWPHGIPEGYQLVWDSVDVLHWEVTPESGKPCRFTVGPERRSCKRPGAARLNRGSASRPYWWAYCADHLYGRRIRDGRLEGLRLVEVSRG